MWGLFGEDCLVIGGEPSEVALKYAGYSELDFFVQHPASEEERDWVGLAPAYAFHAACMLAGGYLVGRARVPVAPPERVGSGA